MPLSWIVLGLLAFAMAGFFLGRARATRAVQGDARKLHSLPFYYGAHVFLMTFVLAFGLLVFWMAAQPSVIGWWIGAGLEGEPGAITLQLSEIKRGAAQLLETGTSPYEAASVVGAGAVRYAGMVQAGHLFMVVAVVLVALGGFFVSLQQVSGEFRARNSVEASVRGLLIGASLIAILTTVGIFLALIFNTIEFFRIYPASQFLFGTVWQPSSGGGAMQPLGLLPLLWGTLFISAIALAVAVPIGLFAAIYLAEYATPRFRNTVKPLLEVLAGIPSIVYGLFALLTVGPMLLKVFGSGGLGWMQGASSVMTAGLVMGIMLIPFVSSLSDDIINAVPQALRDGSYGLGATRSETIRQVVLPAALPGIVGAIILAASRAIGETMLVVFGAGAAGRLSANPFEAMTTVTAKIVSQLTGDSDFTQPEVLVAYALGTTLFLVTLGLNLLAQKIVAKYREQYT